MSFILDALRKSESERQRLGTAAIADLPVGRRRRGQPWWVFALSALLLINLAVLSIVLLRDRTPSVAPITAAVQPIETRTATPVQASAPPPNAAPVINPLQQAAEPTPQVTYETVPRSELDTANEIASSPDGSTIVRPGEAAQVVAPKQTDALPNDSPSQEIHVDLHVYSKNPKERFVMINMHRYSEGQRLPNGANVEQITPEGVVLYQNGTRYQLGR